MRRVSQLSVQMFSAGLLAVAATSVNGNGGGWPADSDSKANGMVKQSWVTTAAARVKVLDDTTYFSGCGCCLDGGSNNHTFTAHSDTPGLSCLSPSFIRTCNSGCHMQPDVRTSTCVLSHGACTLGITMSRKVKEIVAREDAKGLAKILVTKEAVVKYNRGRGAIQVYGCDDPTRVIANLPVSEQFAATVSELASRQAAGD